MPRERAMSINASILQLVSQAREYGLVTAIHSASLSRATAIAAQPRNGMVRINDQTVNCEPQVPFGGMGASGASGRFGGPASVGEFTKTQWLSMTECPIQYPF